MPLLKQGPSPWDFLARKCKFQQETITQQGNNEREIAFKK